MDIGKMQNVLIVSKLPCLTAGFRNYNYSNFETIQLIYDWCKYICTCIYDVNVLLDPSLKPQRRETCESDLITFKPNH